MDELNSRAFDTRFETHKALIHKLARKGYGRLMQTYVSIDYEDVFQEMCVAYVKAVNGFDPSKGITFTAYMGRIIWNEFNKFAEQELIEKTELHVSSFESLGAMSDSEDADIYETIDSGMPTPEEILENKQEIRRKNMSMKPMTKFLVTELIKPSKCVLDAVEQLEEDYDNGLIERRRSVTVALITKQHNLDKKLVKDAKRQLNELYGIGIR